MGETEHKAIIMHLRDAVLTWRQAHQDLSTSERAEVNLRSLVSVIPWVGGAIDQQYWGTIDKRWQNKVDDTLVYITERLAVTSEQVAELRNYYATDEFASLFEATWKRIREASQRRHLDALKGAMLTIISDMPRFRHDKKAFFVGALDRIADVHIYLLQLLNQRWRQNPQTAGQSVEQLLEALNVDGDDDRHFIYGAMDVLANLRMIIHENIPQDGPGGPIDYLRQRFRVTSLGTQFLDFIRSGS